MPKRQRGVAVSLSDCPLRVRSDKEKELLGLACYRSFSTEDLVGMAEIRLGLPRLGPISAIRPTDRVSALAILVGFPDRTQYP